MLPQSSAQGLVGIVHLLRGERKKWTINYKIQQAKLQDPTMKKYTILFGAICAVILAFSLNAKADFISTLSFSNLPPGNPGPYGTVDVSLTGQTATITFTAAAGYFF